MATGVEGIWIGVATGTGIVTGAEGVVTGIVTGVEGIWTGVATGTGI
jgi:hypothetical protein